MERIIYAPDPTFTGTCSGIEFTDGVGICDSDFMAGWLCAKGFTINPESAAEPSAPPVLPDNIEGLKGMSCEQLVEIARTYSIPLSGIRKGDKLGLIAAIEKAVSGGG